MHVVAPPRLTSASASSTDVANGFSTSTCLPAVKARIATSTWLAGGVATSTASTRSSTWSIRSAVDLHRGVVRLRLAQPTHRRCPRRSPQRPAWSSVPGRACFPSTRSRQRPRARAQPLAPPDDLVLSHIRSRVLHPRGTMSAVGGDHVPPTATSSDRTPCGVGPLSSRTRVRRFVLDAHNRSGSYRYPAPLVRSGSQCRLFRRPLTASNGGERGAVLDLCTSSVAFRTTPPRALSHSSTIE
jgi:hypothetical protein